ETAVVAFRRPPTGAVGTRVAVAQRLVGHIQALVVGEATVAIGRCHVDVDVRCVGGAGEAVGGRGGPLDIQGRFAVAAPGVAVDIDDGPVPCQIVLTVESLEVGAGGTTGGSDHNRCLGR